MIFMILTFLLAIAYAIADRVWGDALPVAIGVVFLVLMVIVCFLGLLAYFMKTWD